MGEPLDIYIAEIRRLMETQMWIKGRDLRTQVRRAGRLFPRAVRRDLRYLMNAAKLAENPKLARMVDEAQARKAHANVVRFINSFSPRERVLNQALSIAASVALVLVVVFVVVLYVLVQRGFV